MGRVIRQFAHDDNKHKSPLTCFLLIIQWDGEWNRNTQVDCCRIDKSSKQHEFSKNITARYISTQVMFQQNLSLWGEWN